MNDGHASRCKATRRDGERCSITAGATGYCGTHDPKMIEERRRRKLVIEEGHSDTDLLRAVANAIAQAGRIVQRADFKRALFDHSREYWKAADEWEALEREPRTPEAPASSKGGLYLIEGGAA